MTIVHLAGGQELANVKRDDFWQQNLERHLSNNRVIRRREIVLDLLREFIKPDDRVLNLGCGVGAYSHYIAQRFNRTEALSLDVNLKSLKAGKEHNYITAPINADALHLPLGEQAFEIVLMTEVIEHLKEQSQLLSEVRRVTRNGGYLVLTTSPIKSDMFYNLLRKMRETQVFGLTVDKTHQCEQHPRQLRKSLEVCGFVVVKEKYWNALHLFSIQKLASAPLFRAFLDGFDNRLAFLTSLCADYACVARRE